MAIQHSFKGVHYLFVCWPCSDLNVYAYIMLKILSMMTIMIIILVWLLLWRWSLYHRHVVALLSVVIFHRKLNTCIWTVRSTDLRSICK